MDTNKVWRGRQQLPALIPVFLLLLCSACSDEILRRTYRLVPPAVPEVWLESLGPPSWHFLWIDADGLLSEASPERDVSVVVEILQEYASPVLAYPYWPNRGLRAGVMKPAGAIFPMDARDDTMALSFQGGIDAEFYRELDRFGSGKRIPAYFDWRRFRKLREGKTLSEEMRRDPWRADWKSIAEKTVASGFDARRIKAREQVSITIPAPAAGPWFGASPFVLPYELTQNGNLVLGASSQVDTYLCKDGMLHVTQKTQSWLPYHTR